MNASGFMTLRALSVGRMACFVEVGVASGSDDQCRKRTAAGKKKVQLWASPSIRAGLSPDGAAQQVQGPIGPDVPVTDAIRQASVSCISVDWCAWLLGSFGLPNVVNPT